MTVTPFYFCRYSCQSAFNEYVSLMIPECRSWCSTSRCRENGILKKFPKDSFQLLGAPQNCSITVKCVFISARISRNFSSPPSPGGVPQHLFPSLHGKLGFHSREIPARNPRNSRHLRPHPPLRSSPKTTLPLLAGCRLPVPVE